MFRTSLHPIKFILRQTSHLQTLLRRHWAQKKFLNNSAFSHTMHCTIAYNELGTYCVPLSGVDRPAAQKVLQGQTYEPETITFMQQHHFGNDIIHAGTFFGDFLPGLSSSCSPTQTIWAFEPNPESFDCAQITIALNKLKNVVLNNAGLGDIEQEGSFQTHDAHGHALGGASHFIPQESNHSTRISITTIDARIPPERKIGIIQLDVEGFEINALKGAMRTIRTWHPILILEQFPDADIMADPWFQRNILAQGYSLLTRLHGNLVFQYNPQIV